MKTALTRLVRIRQALTAVIVAYALLWGVATAMSLSVLFRLLGLALGRPATSDAFISGAIVLISGAVGGLVLWLGRKVRSLKEVALWLEWRVPAMRYSLVTLVEARFAAAGPQMEARVAETNWGPPVWRAVLHRLRLPTAILLGSAAGLWLLPPLSLDGAAISANLPRGETLSTRDDADPFRSLLVLVTPPPYSRLPRLRLDRPETATGLVGSSIQVSGDGWQMTTTMPDTATPFWLDRAGKRRLLVLLPVADSVPAVQLLLPARDSVLRGATGGIRLQARSRDDFGLTQAWFEYIVSSGEGENYTFRAGVAGQRSFRGDTMAELVSDLQLDGLRLSPGNIVHLRAVAQDGNGVTGPGIGYSDTRTIRIPRPGEGDSVSVERVAPAGGDSSLLSQRMLIITAEALERRRPVLGRVTFVAESRAIAGDQATLRRRVADIIFLRLGAEGSMEESEDSTAVPLTPEALLAAAEQATASGGETLDFSQDETPVVALNRPLLEAYNAMWAAGRELEIGEARRALPHMRDALEAIQRARQAERIYLRGRPTASVIDLAKVRLAGRLADASPAATVASPRTQKTLEALLARYARVIDLLPSQAAVDSLQLLRIDALGTEPRFAAALGEATSALRAGRDATAALISARRILAGSPKAISPLEPWDVAP